MDFLQIKKTSSRKRKMMLWIDEDLVSKLELMPPVDITVQEKIRQIVKGFMEEDVTDDDIEGL